MNRFLLCLLNVGGHLQRIVPSLFCTLLAVASAVGQPTTLRDSLGQEFRLIGPTHFEMGCRESELFRKDHVNFDTGNDDRPVHAVILSRPYYMATTEVTVGQFASFVEATGYQTTSERAGGILAWHPQDNERNGQPKSSFQQSGEASWKSPGFPQTDSHPVVGISYHDAVAYCQWLSQTEDAIYRLPTEAEWECACRAGTATEFSFGNDYQGIVHKHANLGNVELEIESPGRALRQWLVDVERDPGDGHPFTAPVGSFDPNPWGLQDLHGNVWEWCQDRYLDTYYTQFDRAGHQQVRRRAIDPMCDEIWNEHGEWRVIRGGSWFVAPIQCRSGFRSMMEAGDATCYIGFRVVREPSEQMVTAARQQHQRSESALEFLRENCRSLREQRDGHLFFEWAGEDLNDSILERLAELQYAVEIQVRPPGKLNAELIERICQTKHLTGLILSIGGDALDPADFQPLVKHPELQRLQITGTGNLSNQVLQYLSATDGFISINLQGDRIDDHGWAAVPKQTKLQTLHIASTNCDGAMLDRIAGSPLREASFGELSDAGAKQLATFQSLRNLNLQGCPITGDGLEPITTIRRLESLDLTGCVRLRDPDLAFLSRLRGIERLLLAETQAGDQTAEAMRGLIQLRDLAIGSEQLSDSGLRTLCEIVSIRSLYLTEEASQITESGFSDLWRLQNLDALTIEPPHLDGSGLVALPELPRLKRLHLHGPQISDAAMDFIAQSMSLQEVTFGSWSRRETLQISPQGLTRLAESPTLQKVTLIHGDPKQLATVIEQLKNQQTGIQFDIR